MRGSGGGILGEQRAACIPRRYPTRLTGARRLRGAGLCCGTAAFQHNTNSAHTRSSFTLHPCGPAAQGACATTGAAPPPSSSAPNRSPTGLNPPPPPAGGEAFHNMTRTMYCRRCVVSGHCHSRSSGCESGTLRAKPRVLTRGNPGDSESEVPESDSVPLSRAYLMLCRCSCLQHGLLFRPFVISAVLPHGKPDRRAVIVATRAVHMRRC